MIRKLESTMDDCVTASETPRKSWQTPQVITGTLDEAEVGGIQAIDGINPS